MVGSLVECIGKYNMYTCCTVVTTFTAQDHSMQFMHYMHIYTHTITELTRRDACDNVERYY